MEGKDNQVVTACLIRQDVFVIFYFICPIQAEDYMIFLTAYSLDSKKKSTLPRMLANFGCKGILD